MGKFESKGTSIPAYDQRWRELGERLASGFIKRQELQEMDKMKEKEAQRKFEYDKKLKEVGQNNLLEHALLQNSNFTFGKKGDANAVKVDIGGQEVYLVPKTETKVNEVLKYKNELLDDAATYASKLVSDIELNTPFKTKEERAKALKDAMYTKLRQTINPTTGAVFTEEDMPDDLWTIDTYRKKIKENLPEGKFVYQSSPDSPLQIADKSEIPELNKKLGNNFIVDPADVPEEYQNIFTAGGNKSNLSFGTAAAKGIKGLVNWAGNAAIGYPLWLSQGYQDFGNELFSLGLPQGQKGLTPVGIGKDIRNKANNISSEAFNAGLQMLKRQLPLQQTTQPGITPEQFGDYVGGL